MYQNHKMQNLDLNGIAKGSKWEGNMEQLQILQEHSYARQGKICIEDPTLTEVEVRNDHVSWKKGADKNLSK